MESLSNNESTESSDAGDVSQEHGCQTNSFEVMMMMMIVMMVHGHDDDDDSCWS